MKTKKCGYRIEGVLLIVVLFFAFSGMTSLLCADDAKDSAQLVDKARMTLENFSNAREMEGFRNLIKDANGVFIAPQVLKGAFVIGVSGGSGVFVVRDRKSGTWAGPAFYTIGEASFGLQAGGEASEVILLAMTDRGVTALLGNSAKLGADVGVAVGPVGMGAAASTANLSADIVSFASSKGLFGGIAVDGAVVKVRNGLNQAYYHKKKLTPTDILIRRIARNPHADSLLKAVSGAVQEK
jgi:SH3 domain-containing YSC84-like protein 1